MREENSFPSIFPVTSSRQGVKTKSTLGNMHWKLGKDVGLEKYELYALCQSTIKSHVQAWFKLI